MNENEVDEMIKRKEMFINRLKELEQNSSNEKRLSSIVSENKNNHQQ